MAEPEKPTIFQCIRRYTNNQISSVLHSLVGVPSMLQPPTFTDIENTSTPEPKPTTPSGDEEENKGKRMIEREECRAIERQLFLQNPEEVFNAFLKSAGAGLREALAEEIFWPRSGFEDVRLRCTCYGDESDAKAKEVRRRGAEKGEGGGEDAHDETELDAYAQLLPLWTKPENKTGGGAVSAGGRGDLGVISSVSTTRSVTINGVTKTEYVLKRRFSDGREVTVEERTTTRS